MLFSTVRGHSPCARMPMTTAASTGTGNSASQPRPCHNSKANASAAASPVSLLRPPAASLADDAENPAPTGKPCKAPLARLESPRASNSRRGATRSPCCNARVRTEPQDSANRISNSAGAISAARSQ